VPILESCGLPKGIKHTFGRPSHGHEFERRGAG
jgi:hypothetical protein